MPEERIVKCLSIRQPWALLVCAGAKTVENRTWATTYRGLVAVHAGGYRNAVEELMKYDEEGKVDPSILVYGAIIGVVELVDVIPMNESLATNPWAQGPYCFLFQNATLFLEPIVHKGRVNLCSLPDSVSRDLFGHLDHCLSVESQRAIQECVDAIRPGPIDTRFLRPSV